MSSNRSLLILPGDGIGPEVMREVRRVIEWFGKRRQVSFDIDEDIVGGASIDAHRTPLTDKALDKAMNADAVLFGSVGGPKWDNLGFDMRPEGGLLTLRKELDLFANLRPAICFPALAGASSLKPELVTPAVLFMLSEDAPTGAIITAGAGFFAAVKTIEAEGMLIPGAVSADEVAANWDKISDFSKHVTYESVNDGTGRVFKLLKG